jgi:Leu/Phe-tRNA-protein transferase
MANMNKVENILIKKYFKKLPEINMYWNKRSDEILVYMKSNVCMENANIKILLDVLLQMDNSTVLYFMSSSFNLHLIKKLITCGFSIYFQRNYINKYNKKWFWDDKYNNKKYIYSKLMLQGKIYNRYTILNLNNVHEPKRALKLMDKYELKFDIDFNIIVDKCSEIHGEEWLSVKMRNIYKKLYRENEINFKLVSFALYRNDELKAGEFGCIIRNMYISYSGYHEESSAGTVQLLKMFRYLKENKIMYCDLGPASEKFKYKYRFGAIDVEKEEYYKMFFN